MILSNGGVLLWYEKLSQQFHRRDFMANQKRFTLVTELNQIPPFQLIVSNTAASITEFKLVNKDTGAETDILSSILNTSLVLETNQDSNTYDRIRYIANQPIPVSILEQGDYYCKMTYGAFTWYSEVFTMCPDVSQFIKIEYCHSENFPLNTGVLKYNLGYENYFYIKPTIGISSPAYEYENEIDKRTGIEFPLRQITWKEYTLKMLAHEAALDFMRLIPLHDTVKITDKLYTYNTDKFELSPEPQQSAGVYIAEILFTTDTTVVSETTGARGTATCGIVAGNCLPDVQYTAKSTIIEGSAEDTGFYYVNSLGVNTDFVDGDYVIVYNEGTDTYILRRYNAGDTYTSQIVTDLFQVYDLTNDRYFQQFGANGLRLPEILSYTLSTPYTVTGRANKSTTVKVWSITSIGTKRLSAIGSDTDFSSGLTYTRQNGDRGIYIEVFNTSCGLLFTSPTTEYPIPDAIESQGNYDTADDAISGGLVDGDYFVIPINSPTGYAGAVVQLNPTNYYISDQDAMQNGVPLGGVYALANGNLYGGVIYSMKTTKAAHLTTYANDQTAVTIGGLSVGDLYILSEGNSYGMPSYSLREILS